MFPLVANSSHKAALRMKVLSESRRDFSGSYRDKIKVTGVMASSSTPRLRELVGSGSIQCIAYL
jgi:hypothetical protein